MRPKSSRPQGLADMLSPPGQPGAPTVSKTPSGSLSRQPAPDPAAWMSRALLARSDWRFALSSQHQSEVLAAVDRSRTAGVPLERLTRADFPLPEFGRLLESIRRQVVDGVGVSLVRGLPIDRLDREGTARAWLGIGAWLGVARPQNRAGHLLGHVYDLGEDSRDPKTRLYRTNARQRFHIDSCDVVGLLCLRPAKHGGASAVASSVAVADAIARERPDLHAVLEEPFVYDRKGEVPDGKGPWYRIPIVHRHDGLTSVFFARDFIESAQRRFPEVPRLTPAQIEAMDRVEQLAESDEFRVDMAFEPGDMQFVHNHVVLHARTAYEDWPEPARKRHLLRLWLCPAGARPLPPVFAERYGPLDGPARGGIQAAGAVPRVPLDPE